jgi:L-rhamnose mutarotase
MSMVSEGSTRRRFCLTLDLKKDPELIAEYKRYHEKVWPEITQSLKDAGVVDMEIYLLDTRMFMIMEVNEGISFGNKAQMDLANAKVREWEELMGRFQNPLPNASPVERWQLMEKVFELEK